MDRTKDFVLARQLRLKHACVCVKRHQECIKAGVYEQECHCRMSLRFIVLVARDGELRNGLARVSRDRRDECSNF